MNVGVDIDAPVQIPVFISPGVGGCVRDQPAGTGGGGQCSAGGVS